jgi:hypothetical protein
VGGGGWGVGGGLSSTFVDDIKENKCFSLNNFHKISLYRALIVSQAEKEHFLTVFFYFQFFLIRYWDAWSQEKSGRFDGAGIESH